MDSTTTIEGHLKGHPRTHAWTYTEEHIVVVRYSLILGVCHFPSIYLEAFLPHQHTRSQKGAIPNSDTQRLLGARVKGPHCRQTDEGTFWVLRYGPAGPTHVTGGGYQKVLFSRVPVCLHNMHLLVGGRHLYGRNEEEGYWEEPQSQRSLNLLLELY